MIHLATLFSGSSGNSVLVRSGEAAFLIDAGRSCKAVCNSLRRLNCGLEDLSCVFVTHEHSDHISALDVMMRKRPMPIHVSSPSAPELCRKQSAAGCAVVHRGLYFTQCIGDMTVSSFPLPHDSAAQLGYFIECDDGDTAAVATDMGCVTEEAFGNLSRCRTAVIESNHDEDMLRRGPYPYSLKTRILSKAGHLSNKDCSELCLALAETGRIESILLAHLSAENNTPALALGQTRSTLQKNGYENIAVCVADREIPTVI